MSLTLTLATAALAVGLEPSLLQALCFAESSHQNVIRPIDGKRASLGVCQTQLETAREVIPGVTPSELLRPEVNARAAALYLKKKIKQYNNETCGIAAYNQGSLKHCDPRRVSRWRYVRKVRLYQMTRPWSRDTWNKL